jgi:hypothetical protein
MESKISRAASNGRLLSSIVNSRIDPRDISRDGNGENVELLLEFRFVAFTKLVELFVESEVRSLSMCLMIGEYVMLAVRFTLEPLTHALMIDNTMLSVTALFPLLVPFA